MHAYLLVITLSDAGTSNFGMRWNYLFEHQKSRQYYRRHTLNLMYVDSWPNSRWSNRFMNALLCLADVKTYLHLKLNSNAYMPWCFTRLTWKWELRCYVQWSDRLNQVKTSYTMTINQSYSVFSGGIIQIKFWGEPGIIPMVNFCLHYYLDDVETNDENSQTVTYS